LGFHKYEKKRDPFGFGDMIGICKYCGALDVKITVYNGRRRVRKGER
jgi:hypothetical protein